MDQFLQHKYFFDNGLQFECRQCGRCCTGDPGLVRVTPGEIEAISRYLGIVRSFFIKQYLYTCQESFCIREDEKGRCLFYQDGCRIYPVRPMQCRTFPFWFDNLRSEKKWRQIAAECPGIGSGRSYSKSEILDILNI